MVLRSELGVQEVAVDDTHFWYLRENDEELVRCPHEGCAGEG